MNCNSLRYLHLYDGGVALKTAEELGCRNYALPLCYLVLIDLYPHSFRTEDCHPLLPRQPTRSLLQETCYSRTRPPLSKVDHSPLIDVVVLPCASLASHENEKLERRR